MKKYFLIIGIVLASGLMLACEKEITRPSIGNNSGGGSGNSNDGVNVEQLVSQYVSVSSTYSHTYYMYVVTIHSSLSTEYPGHNVKYGLECGYGDYAYYKEKSGGSSIEFKAPLFTAVNSYCQNEPWAFSTTNNWPSGQLPADEEMSGTIYYAKIFYALREKMDSGQSLTSDETSMYNQCVSKLNAVEARAKSLFIFRAYVLVDGTKYNL